MVDINPADTNDKVPLPSLRWMNYVLPLFRKRKFILLNFLIVTIVSLVVSFFLPKWYKSTASILPPKNQTLLNPLGAVASTLKGLGSAGKIGGIGENQGTYNYLAILKSRTAMELVVQKFDLIQVYGLASGSMEKTIEMLRDNVSFELQEDDNITITVFDRDSQRAADIANYFVDVLNTLSNELSTREARENRLFIEKRLDQTRAELHSMEDSLQKFQEHSDVALIPGENMTDFAGIADLYGLKVRKEIELGVLGKKVSKDNEAFQQLKLELMEIDHKLSGVPESGIQTIRLYRNIAIQQKILEYLVPLYEQAKIDEQKDVPVILVLDKAVPSEHKAKPKRLFFILGWDILALFLSVFYIIGKERLAKLKSDGRLNSFFDELRASKLIRIMIRRKE
jgi:tyrosine-protein kinase Etk/Wzc